MKKNASLTIIVPAFNEEEAIKNVVKSILRFKNRVPYLKLEIIIVDDGSTDRTFNVSSTLAKKYKKLNIKVLKHNHNKGPGAALRTGNNYSTSDFVTYVPADEQFDVNELKRFIEEIKNYDLVIGYRTSRESDSMLRRILSQIFAHVVRILFQVNVRDFNWIYLYRRSRFKKIKIKSNGFFILSEIIVKSFKNELKVKEIPSNFYPRKIGKSGNLRPKGINQAVFEMIKVWIELM